MLKAFYGDDATPENDFGYAWLPKRNAAKDYSIFGIFESALAGKMKMLWVVGQNPAVTSPNLRIVHEAMGKLEMLVVQEIWDTETASFWQRPGVDPEDDPDRGAPAAGRVLHGEERHDHELGRDGAVAARRGEAAGTGQARRRDRRRRVPPRARPRPRLEGAEGRDRSTRPTGPT